MQLWNGTTTHPAELVGFPSVETRDGAVESHTEYLIEECKSLDYVKQLEHDWELSETDLMEKLIQAIAEWSGRTDGKNGCKEQMYKLHNILFAQIKETIAEREVA